MHNHSIHSARAAVAAFAFLIATVCSERARATPFNPDTDWFHDARYGVFMHVLPSDAASLQALDNFDVEALANQLAEIDAGYLVLALGQNSGYYNAPNPTYEAAVGYAAGTRCAVSDLPKRLIDALKPRGIRLMAYLPCQTPNADTKAQEAFGLSPQADSDRPIDLVFAIKWAKVIQDWSVHYGGDVAGWWFDGGYQSVGFNAEIARVYADAVHAGSPHAIVTFNPGVELTHYNDVEDYTAGETNQPLSLFPQERWLQGSQWHSLTYLGAGWAQSTPRFTSQQWADWVAKVVSRGGVVSLDSGFQQSGAAWGTLAPALMDHLRAIRDAVGPRPKPDAGGDATPETGLRDARAETGNAQAGGDESVGMIPADGESSPDGRIDDASRVGEADSATLPSVGGPATTSSDCSCRTVGNGRSRGQVGFACTLLVLAACGRRRRRSAAA